MVTNKGYTKSARKNAIKSNITLYYLDDICDKIEFKINLDNFKLDNK
jgi:HJR/Mrr/RecB family endonuclease